MNKTVPPPQIRALHRFLFEKPFNEFPHVNHALFAVLALIGDGNTEKQIISALDSKVTRSTIMTILARIADEEWALYDEVGGDRVWHIQPPGQKILGGYLLVMRKGTVR